MPCASNSLLCSRRRIPLRRKNIGIGDGRAEYRDRLLGKSHQPQRRFFRVGCHGPCGEGYREYWTYKPFLLEWVSRQVQTTVTISFSKGSKD